MCTDFGIHYREGREVVYAWFLRMGHTYREARMFFDTLPPIMYSDTPPKTTTYHLTRELQTDFMRICNDAVITTVRDMGYEIYQWDIDTIDLKEERTDYTGYGPS